MPPVSALWSSPPRASSYICCSVNASLRLVNRYSFLGGGSNLLLTGDFEGTVLHSAIMGIEDISAIEGPQSDSVLLRVGSGVVWDDFVAYCVARGWNGAENLSLIPGEVGASAVQNIGA